MNHYMAGASHLPRRNLEKHNVFPENTMLLIFMIVYVFALSNRHDSHPLMFSYIFPLFSISFCANTFTVYRVYPQHGTLFWMWLTVHGAHAETIRCDT